MDIKEILERPSPAHYTVEELQFAVEKYIEQKKGSKVTVNIFKNVPKQGMNTNQILALDHEYSLLMNAFTTVQNNYTK